MQKDLLDLETDLPGKPGIRMRAIYDTTDPAAKTVRFELSADGTTEDWSVACTSNWLPGADPIDGTHEIALTVDDNSRDRLDAAGIIGARFEGATVSAARIVVRGPGPDGGWSLQAPRFEMHLCWTLTAGVGAASTGANGMAIVEATAEVEICAGLALLRPDWPGLSNLAVRLDAPSIGLTTGWLPLELALDLDLPDIDILPELRLDPLVAWFCGLTGVDLGDWGAPVLPAWGLDLPVDLDLPLGIGVKETRLSLARPGNRLAFTAVAKGFFVTWDGQAMTDPVGEVSLTFDRGQYILTAVLFSRQWPRTQQELNEGPYGFSLPFGLFGLKAQAWYLHFGLRLEGAIGSGTPRACFELLLEIGGLAVTSSIAQGDLYRTDLRILLLDRSVISNTIASGNGPALFDRASRDGAVGAHFEQWRQHPIPAHSFADRLGETPEGPENDYGLEFLDGTFRKGERVALLWRMNGGRLIKALVHDLFGGLPAGAQPPGEARTTYALEWLAEADGTWQLRLDWRSDGAGSVWEKARALALPAINDGCVSFAPVGGLKPPLAVALPLAPQISPAVGLDGQFDTALTLSLPGVRLDLARPQDQAIVLSCPPGDDWSVSHLMLYPEAPQVRPAVGAAADIRAPVALARVGFTVNDAGKKGLYETATGADANPPFLTLGAGPANSVAPFAIRSIGWRKGQSPRFLQTARGGRGAAIRLIPEDLPNPANGAVTCPGTPRPLPAPGLVRFDDFASPRLGDWQMSIRLAAENALFRMFGDAANPGQTVSFTVDRICEDAETSGEVLLHCTLTVDLGGSIPQGTLSRLTGKVVFRFDLADLSVRIDGAARLALQVDGTAEPDWAKNLKLPDKRKKHIYAADIDVAGLKLTPRRLRRADDPQAPQDAKVDVLSLDLRGGRFVFGVPPDTDLIASFVIDGKRIAFLVKTFALGPGGLDLEANLISDSVSITGLPAISLTAARMRILGGRLDLLEIKGSSTLPAILEYAPIAVTLTFDQDANGTVRLKGLGAELGEKGKPIFSRGTRFRFEIEELDLYYNDIQKRAWFELTGSASFVPQAGPDGEEFADGLLGELKSVTLSFTRLRLDEGTDLLSSLSLMAQLNRPVRFGLFGVFEMEIRSIGLHPKFDKFEEPAPAVLIGGQIRFADFGDVIQAEIDFHTLAIGMPETDHVLPQVYANGLRVVISTAEGFKIGGRLDQIDDGRQKGFRGEGVVQVPGLPELACAFAFLKVVPPDGGPGLRAWFIAIEASKISYLVGGALPIYLRQIGLGFGYRFTLPLIADLSQIEDPKELIKAMLAALDRHQTLARIEAWTLPDNPRDSNWTIALEGVLSLGTTQPTPFDYSAKSEREMRTIFAQILAAYRSDFTLVAAAKLWFPVSVDDFFNDKKGMRAKPLARGFLAYSAPRNRLVAHAASVSDPYLGDEANQPFPHVLKAALAALNFEVTLLVEPGLVHAELGWPDRLTFGLKVGPLAVQCRGGILIRLTREMLIYGYYFSASGQLALSGGVDLGVVGVQIEALASVTYATRLLIGANTRKPEQSMLYGAIGLDLTVQFRLRAWLRIKLGFARVTIRISFSFSLQLTVLGEIGWAGGNDLGFRGRATLSVRVFGRSLGLRVDVGVNKSDVDKARDMMQGYAQSILEPGKVPVFPGLKPETTVSGGASPGAAKFAAAPNGPSGLAQSAALSLASVGTAASPAVLDETAQPDDFVLSLRRGAAADQGRLWFGWIMPGPNGRAFYPAVPNPPAHGETYDYASISVPDGAEVFVHRSDGWMRVDNDTRYLQARLDAKVPFDEPVEGASELTLNQLLAAAHEPVPAHPVTEQQKKALLERFPAEWPFDGLILQAPTPDAAPRELARDRRVFDPDSPAGGLRRTLDPDDPWDAMLALAAEPDSVKSARSPEDEELRQQALANQALLLQGFFDDLCTIAATTSWEGELPRTDPLAPGRPTLFDLGMIICIRTQDDRPPDWASKRASNDALKVAFPDLPASQARDVKAVADFELIDFATAPPRVPDAASRFDEDGVVVAWTLDWAGEKFKAERFADGACHWVEGYVEAYEITLVDAQTRAVLHNELVTHTETVGKRKEYVPNPATGEVAPVITATALAPRFGFSRPLAELPLRQDMLSSRGAQLIVSMRPVGQTGAVGGTFSFPVDYRPILTPMAAEAPEAVLSPGADEIWNLRLKWRQPPLPEGGGVASTAGWRLVLRPLPRTPFGAYPDAASDATDRATLGGAAGGLADGDIQVPLGVLSGVGEKTVDLPAELEGRPFFDHKGLRLDDDDPAAAAARGFVERRSAARPGGHGWLLLLVATSGEDKTELSDRPISAAAPVTLLLKTGAQPLRPVAHLEWPERLDTIELPGVVAATDLAAWAGPANVPWPTWNDETGAGFTFGKSGSDPNEDSSSDGIRAVTVVWTVLPSGNEGADILPQAAASYEVHEWVLDDMVNRDAVAPPLGGGYVALRRIVPVEAGRARELPLSLHDVMNWDSQPCTSSSQAAPPKWPLLDWPAWTEATDAAKAARGQDLARRPVHPGLAILLAEVEDRLSDLRIEVLDGPPLAAARPFDWLAATSVAVDPNGWAALSGLGLSVVLAARDPITGRLADQGQLVKAAEAAYRSLNGSADPAACLAAAHLAVDMPVQHPQAYRADASSESAADIGLAMVQLSLRPREGTAAPAGTEPARQVPPGWIGLLARAFARATPGAPDLEASRAADQQRLETELSAAVLPDAYSDWAMRFAVPAFRPDPADFAKRLSATQQRSVEPLLVAADGAATLRMTRLIGEQWATVRRYAVTVEGRYDRLLGYDRLADAGGAPPDHDSPGADAYLPRVRALEPPRVLHLGVVRSAIGRPFHDVVVTHPERRLSERNRSVQARLEFGMIRRSYERSWPEVEFYNNLVGPDPADINRNLLAGATLGLVSERPDTLDPEGAGTFPEDALLADAPAARWGAVRYRDAAEPFYLRQTLRLEATAGDGKVKRTGPIALPAQMADATVPLGNGATLNWDKVSVRAFAGPDDTRVAWDDDQSAARLTLAAAWQDRVGPAIAAWFDTRRYDLRLRLPHYVESLAPPLREAYFPQETMVTDPDGARVAPVGLLPDHEARLLAVAADPDTGTVAPLVQVTPVGTADYSGNPQEPFRTEAVAAAVALDSKKVAPAEGKDWTDGLWLTATLRERQTEPFAETDLTGVPEVNELIPLGTLPTDTQLPQSGPLACLAPLALRLVVHGAAPSLVGLIEPLVAPERGVLRPHLWQPPGGLDQTAGDMGDLAIALRLLVDAPRRRLAAAVAADLANAPDLPGARRLLREIETVPVAWRTGEVAAADMGDVVALAFASSPKGAVQLWLRDADQWTVLSSAADPVPAVALPTTLVVLMQHKVSAAPWPGPDPATAMADWATHQSGLPQPPQDLPDPARSLALGDLAQRVASAAFRGKELARPQAQVLRGNAPPQRWDRGDE